MSDLRVYPPSEPRLVATRAGRRIAAKYVAASSKRARARWWVAERPYLGRGLWRSPPPHLTSAWDIAVGFLREKRQIIVGVLSDSGPEQRLTLIPAEENIVVKIAVHASGDAAIERERANLSLLQETDWRLLGPRLFEDSRTKGIPRAVLLMDRIAGEHPQWDDPVVHRELFRAFSLSGGDNRAASSRDTGVGLHHGDVTPWNVVQRTNGTLMVLDWEFADFSMSTHPVCGVLDFVLRGAIVARAKPSRVRPVLLSAIQHSGIDTTARGDVMNLYRTYRVCVQDAATERSDSLSRQTDRLLDACLAGG